MGLHDSGNSLRRGVASMVRRIIEWLFGWMAFADFSGDPSIDERREYAPDHNPGFDLNARRKTARQHGLKI
jgi:hypothetical protein